MTPKQAGEYGAWLFKYYWVMYQMTPEYQKRERERIKRKYDAMYFLAELKAKQEEKPKSFLQWLFNL